MPTEVLDCSQEATGDIWGGRHLHGGGGPGSASRWVGWDLSSPTMLITRPEAAPGLGKGCPPGRPQALLDPTRGMGCLPGPVDGGTPTGVPLTRSHCRSHMWRHVAGPQMITGRDPWAQGHLAGGTQGAGTPNLLLLQADPTAPRWGHLLVTLSWHPLLAAPDSPQPRVKPRAMPFAS